MNKKYKIFISIIIFFFFLFISYGYAALNTELSISGEAYVRVKEDIRVTNLKLSSMSSGGYETYNSKYSINTVGMFVTLPSGKSAIFEVEITNQSSNDYFLKRVINNTNYEFIDTKIYDVFSKNSVRKFYIKITNRETVTKEIALNMEFEFEKDGTPTITMNDLPTWLTKGDEYQVTTVYNAGPSGGTASCKSNVDTGISNVTDLKVLSKGTHNITCTVTSNTGKTASVMKSTKITYDPYNSTNIISNGSFENSLSGITAIRGTASKSTSYSYHGSYSLQLAPAANVHEAYGLFPAFNYVEGHKYYYQLYYYIPSNAPSTASIELFCLAANRDSDVGLPHASFVARGGAIANIYVDKPDWKSNNTMQFRFDNNNLYENVAIYYDAAIAIDLTATFGSGNEPDVAWCQKHIQFFDGKKVIYK